MGRRDAGGMLGRRGLMAGAAALVAGGLARLAGPGRAEAGHNNSTGYSSEGVLHADETNSTSSTTAIDSTAPVATTFKVSNRGGATAFEASSTIDGLSSGTGDGVSAFTDSASAANSGVRGLASNAATGVRGESGNGNGVFGVSTNASGIYGFSGNSYGVLGASSAGVGVYATSSSSWGLHATSPVFAGVFSGAVYVNGQFTVAGNAKSAAVKKRDGSHVRVYCQESPEPWFEDFGRAELEDGRAVVPLDPEFDEVVRGDDYQVFLTEYRANQALYVADLRPHRFEVRSNNGTAASGPFGYRVVARRRDDVGRRLEKVDVPDFTRVRRPPPPPDLPTVPERPSR